MTDIIKKLLRRIETWPKEAQEDLAASARTIESRHAIEDELTEDDWKIINRRVKRRQLTNDDDVRALFAISKCMRDRFEEGAVSDLRGIFEHIILGQVDSCGQAG